MEILIIALMFGGSVAAWMRDMYDNTRRLGDEDQEDVIAAIDRAYALADLMLLAVMADGELREDELAMLRTNLEVGDFGVTFEELVARVGARRKQAISEPELRRAVSLQANRLDAEGRELAYSLVCNLHRAGARLQRYSGYRDGVRRGEEVLLEIFGEALEIPPARRPVLAERPLELPKMG